MVLFENDCRIDIASNHIDHFFNRSDHFDSVGVDAYGTNPKMV